MTKRRTGDPWKPAAEYGRSLEGLSLNLLVRDVERSLPFYTGVLNLTEVYHDVDFAALEGPHGMKLMLHADHTYDGMPWHSRLQSAEPRGLGAEVRILGVDPDAVEARARDLGVEVMITTADFPHGWRSCTVVDPDGYTFAVGAPTKP